MRRSYPYLGMPSSLGNRLGPCSLVVLGLSFLLYLGSGDQTQGSGLFHLIKPECLDFQS